MEDEANWPLKHLFLLGAFKLEWPKGQRMSMPQQKAPHIWPLNFAGRQKKCAEMSTKLNEEGGSNLRCVTLSHLSNFALLLLDEKVRRRSFVQQRTVGKNSLQKVPFTHWGKKPHFIQKIHILKIPIFLQNS